MNALIIGGRHTGALALLHSHALTHRLALRACFDEALAMFDALVQMCELNVGSALIVRALQSCAKLGALSKGRSIERGLSGGLCVDVVARPLYAALCAFECVTESLRSAALINATMADLTATGATHTNY